MHNPEMTTYNVKMRNENKNLLDHPDKYISGTQ
jgi:hypothetical protein